MAKHIVFLTEVNSVLHGPFQAGDVAKNIDDKFAAEMIAGKWAKETSDDSAASDAAAAAHAAGRLAPGYAKGGGPLEVVRFHPADEKAMTAAGVIKPTAGSDAEKGAAPAVSTTPVAARAAPTGEEGEGGSTTPNASIPTKPPRAAST